MTALLAASSIPLLSNAAASGAWPATSTRAHVNYVYRATITASAVATDPYQTSTGKLTMTFRVVLRVLPYPKRGRYPPYSLVQIGAVKLLGYSGSVSASTVAGCSVSRALRRGAQGFAFAVVRPEDGSKLVLQLSFNLSYDHLPEPPPTDCYAPSAEASWFQRQAFSERSFSINATDEVSDVRFEKSHSWLKRPSVLGEPPYSRLIAGKGFVVEAEQRYKVGRDRRSGKVRIVFMRA